MGLDYFFSRIFSLGVVGRIYKMFPRELCGDTYNSNACIDLPEDSDPGFSWYFGLAATYHFPLRFGRRNR